MFNTNNEFKITPCGPSEPCVYDDCESDDDETDKDLAILTEEEAEKVDKPDKPWSKCKEGKGKKEKQDELTKKNENEGEVGGRKKRPCRKIIKNPFFTNRLKFSTDLPPRPPVPPPQFFPLADEDSKPKVCPKKKKCKRKRREPKIGFCDDEFNDGEMDEELCEENDEDLEDNEPICKCCDLGDRGRGKKRKKPKDNFHCKKKASDSSIPPQPRRIPALLKDLPLTCPKDIPEVKRQIQMSLDCDIEKKCRKKCKNKEKVEKLLNQ